VTLTLKERLALAQQFSHHIVRMQKCLQPGGHRITDDELVKAWTTYSSEICAGWLTLPDNYAELLDILLQHMPKSKNLYGRRWLVKVKDAGDGTGDLIIRLPIEVVKKLGWTEGDEVTWSHIDGGGIMVLRAGDGG